MDSLGRRLLKAVGSIAVGAVVLSGCGTPPPGEAPGGTSEEGRRAFSGSTLRVLLKEGYEIDAIQKFVPEFEAATGIDVELEVYDEPTARQKLVLDATSNTGTYDVTSGSFWNMPEFVKAGWLEPLDGYVSDKKDDWLNMEDIPSGALESMNIDGTLYELPHKIIGGMFY